MRTGWDCYGWWDRCISSVTPPCKTTSPHLAASQMPTDHGLPLVASCRHLTDRACAHANLGQEEEALALLLTVEGMSPDWIRHQTFARAVVQDLLTVERRRSTPLRELAKRIGASR